MFHLPMPPFPAFRQLGCSKAWWWVTSQRVGFFLWKKRFFVKKLKQNGLKQLGKRNFKSALFSICGDDKQNIKKIINKFGSLRFVLNFCGG